MKTLEFSNGFKVVYKKIPDIKLVRMGLINPNGILQENRNNLEVAHFFEHLAGHFTSYKYPNGKENLKKLEYMGIQSNAHTSHFYVELWLEGKTEFMKQCLDYLLETMLNFKIDKKIFEQEKLAVIHELQKVLNMPFRKKEEIKLLKLYSGLDGSSKLIDRIKSSLELSSDDCMDFYNAFWTPDQCALYISGDFNVDTLIAFCVGKFRSLQNNPALPQENYPRVNLRDFKLPNDGRKIKIIYVKDDTTSNTNVELIFNCKYGNFNKNKTTLLMIRRVLIGGFNSRLIKRLRHQLGIVYSVQMDVDLSPFDNSLNCISISSDIADNHIELFISALLQELSKLCNKPPSENELSKIKNIVQTEYLQQKLPCNLENEVSENAKRLLYNQTIKTDEEIYNEYMSIDAQTINKMCKKLFKIGKMQILYSGKRLLNSQIETLLKKIILY